MSPHIDWYEGLDRVLDELRSIERRPRSVVNIDDIAIAVGIDADRLLRTLCGVAAVAIVAIAQSPWAITTLLAHVVAGSVWTLGLANFNIAVQLSSPR